MGTAFVEFLCDEEAGDRCLIEIGKIVFRSLIEEIEREKPGDDHWIGYLDAAYGIKSLYVGKLPYGKAPDYGPSFLRAIRSVRKNGPPDYYPDRDLDLLYRQLDLLEETYLRVRPD